MVRLTVLYCHTFKCMLAVLTSWVYKLQIEQISIYTQCINSDANVMAVAVSIVHSSLALFMILFMINILALLWLPERFSRWAYQHKLVYCNTPDTRARKKYFSREGILINLIRIIKHLPVSGHVPVGHLFPICSLLVDMDIHTVYRLHNACS